MTSHRWERCNHCGTRYYYQSSGEGCQRKENDDRHCPDCRKIIIAALNSVPEKFDKVWVKTDEVDIQSLIDREKEKAEEIRKRGNIYGRHIVVPHLFDMHDYSNNYDGWITWYNGRQYKIETWSKTPEKNSLKVAMEKNLDTGDMIYWRK